MKTEYTGNILAVRAVEDCIRVTKKYTKGIFKIREHHPVQGEEFPSRVVTEYYEVYPEMEISWNMLATDAWMWVWGDTPCIDVRFWYDYRKDAAGFSVRGNNNTVKELTDGIPGLDKALELLRRNGNGR